MGNTEVEVTFVWGGEGGTMSVNEESVAIAPRQYVSLLRQMQKLDDARLRASMQVQKSDVDFVDSWGQDKGRAEKEEPLARDGSFQN